MKVDIKVFKLIWDVTYTGIIGVAYKSIPLFKGDLLFFSNYDFGTSKVDGLEWRECLVMIKRGDIIFTGIKDMSPSIRDINGFSTPIEECTVDITISWTREERLKELGI